LSLTETELETETPLNFETARALALACGIELVEDTPDYPLDGSADPIPLASVPADPPRKRRRPQITDHTQHKLNGIDPHPGCELCIRYRGRNEHQRWEAYKRQCDSGAPWSRSGAANMRIALEFED
jgi:hypothetical protein